MVIRKNKILIVICSALAISLAFVLPWFSNHIRYEKYSKNVEENFVKAYGTNMSALSEIRLAEAGEVSERNLAMTMCLNRYRKENHSFAPALTACKQELLFDLTR